MSELIGVAIVVILVALAWIVRFSLLSGDD